MVERKEKTMNNSIKPGIIGLGVGIAIGAVAALALSPKSGKENRAVVINQYNKSKDATVNKLKRKGKDDKKATSTKKK